MRARGMTYDTGLLRNGHTSHPAFDPVTVRRELRIIRDDLHCTAVQIIGGDADRLEQAARHAAELGLEVWFTPYPLELTVEQMRELFLDCAERAERLRVAGANVVFVAGSEHSVMNQGFVDGGSITERVDRLLGDPVARHRRIAEASDRVNAFLRTAIPEIRARFAGPVTYAAIPFEHIDPALLDIVTVELIRSAEVADRFRDGVRALVAQGKPVAITGFGAATWRGAGDVAPRSMEIVEYGERGEPLRLDSVYERDEEGQAKYLREVLEIFDDEGVDSTFVFLFALHSHPHRPDGDPREDLDIASFGIVAPLEGRRGSTYPDMPWEPKAAFAAVAESYRPAS